MKRNHFATALGTALVVLAFGAFGTIAAASAGTGDRATVSAAATLDQEEVDTLLHMTEEEKLAHDVYVTFDEQWDVPVFARISSAEATHLSAMQGLLQTYGIVDPTAGNGLGEFTDPALAALYTQYVTSGSVSVEEALRVGALIEETDIADLTAALAATDQSDIQTVYTHLLSGSQQHLRAFVHQLDVRGVVYAPVVLDEATYAGIVEQTEQTMGRERGMGRTGPLADAARHGRAATAGRHARQCTGTGVTAAA